METADRPRAWRWLRWEGQEGSRFGMSAGGRTVGVEKAERKGGYGKSKNGE